MVELLLVVLAGFGAAMVDGALGMGFGPTSSTLLLATGMPLASVSTAVNTAKVASGLAAGVSHWRFNNIDRRLVLQLAIPGAIGALVGAALLRVVDPGTLRPLVSALLAVVALRMLHRFSRPLVAAGNPVTSDDAPPEFDGDGASSTFTPSFEVPGVRVAASVGGVTNGLIGAWGPVVTPFLLHRGVPPRFAIGSVNTAEVAVATVAAGSLLASAAGSGLDLAPVLAMMLGGVLAAPLAAYVIRFIPARAMGVAVGGMLLLSNVRELATWADLAATRWALYGVVAALVVGAALAPRIRLDISPAAALAAALVGNGGVVLGSFLPWVLSGGASRNSYATLRSAERLEVVANPTAEAMLQAWYLVPVGAALVALGLSLHRVRLAGFAAAATSIVAAACALLALDAGIRVGIGPAVCALGAVVLAVGSAAWAAAHRRCAVCTP
jgi:uncharacterized membrane protein YfcA